MHRPTLKKFQKIAHEVSGSPCDLGTFLPLVLGGIAVAGCNPGAVFSLGDPGTPPIIQRLPDISPFGRELLAS